MNITTRAELGWSATDAAPARPTKGLVVHYDGSNQGLASKPHGACLAYWRTTRAFHVGPSRGWLDIGYSWACCPHGVILEGRGLGREQAAQPGGNATYYSVTFMGGPAEDPTAEQIRAFRELRSWLMAKHGVGRAVKGHRDFINTTCPGDRNYRLITSGALIEGEDDDMPTAKDLWKYEIPVPWGSKENPEWQAKSLLVESNKLGRSIVEILRRQEAKLDAQGAVILELSAAIAAMQPGEVLDVEALVSRIEQAIEGIQVRLDVPDPAAPAA
jgi:hypothetical protein